MECAIRDCNGISLAVVVVVEEISQLIVVHFMNSVQLQIGT